MIFPKRVTVSSIKAHKRSISDWLVIMNHLKKYASYLGFLRDKENKDDYRTPFFAKSPRANKPLRVRVLGDHSKLHCGCKAVIDSLERAVKDRGWEVVKSCRPYDVLIVNGEGSMHNSRKTFLKKMSILQKAVNRGIPCKRPAELPGGR